MSSEPFHAPESRCCGRTGQGRWWLEPTAKHWRSRREVVNGTWLVVDESRDREIAVAPGRDSCSLSRIVARQIQKWWLAASCCRLAPRPEHGGGDYAVANGFHCARNPLYGGAPLARVLSRQPLSSQQDFPRQLSLAVSALRLSPQRLRGRGEPLRRGPARAERRRQGFLSGQAYCNFRRNDRAIHHRA